jgi:putative hydroxymethylpyrimidine transport system substrate-binding protein
MNRLLAPALALVAALALSACGEKEDPTGAPAKEKLTLLLDFFPNADHAGIYQAQASGEFDRAGLDVRIEAPADPSAPLKLLQAGKADVAISYEPELLLARDKGADVVSIAALVQKPLTSIMAIGKTRLDSPADLEGHTVGTAGIPYQSAYLKTILREAGADPATVKEVDVGFDLSPALLSKKVYATLGAFWNYEGIALERKSRDPKIIRVDEVGVPTYNELVLVTRTEAARTKAATFRRFLQALARAHESLRENPTAGVHALLEANPDLERGLQTAVVEATLPVFFPKNTDRPWGWQEPAEWRDYSAWMLDNDLLTQPASPGALTNDLLPGEGFEDE